MTIDNAIFYPGRVKYNTFNIDFDKPFMQQLDALNEDLIQVEYDGDYRLDIGWYPEADENGKFIIQLICNNDWNKPIVKDEQKEYQALLDSIQRTIEMRLLDH